MGNAGPETQMDQQERELLNFEEREYPAISQNTSTSLQMMAVLLTLYFVFNGALFTAVLSLLGSAWRNTPLPYLPSWQLIHAAGLILFPLTLTFSLWAYFFTKSFGQSAFIAVTRGAEIETQAYGSSKGTKGFFLRMKEWLHSATAYTLALLSTIFICLVQLIWFCLGAMLLLTKT